MANKTNPLADTLLPFSLMLAFVMVVSLSGCNGKDNPDPQVPPEQGKAQVYLTKGDRSLLFSREEPLEIISDVNNDNPVISLDTGFRFQAIEGYGAALTGSSAYLLNNTLNPSARQDVLKELFDPETGIGISYLRLTMGASDFSVSDFTYNDLPAGQTDFGLQQFSLAQDLNDVVPVLKEITQIAPAIKLMGTPWSPPAWMKTNGNLKGGKLRPDCYGVYADYFVKYIQAMKDEGITIDAITPQNEPLYYTAGYPCMEMQSSEQLAFIKNSLGPRFETAGISSKIILYDHNWDNPQYPITILNDADAAKYVAGSAFHAYGGDVSAMTTVHNAHPDKGLYFTEISGGAWATDFAGNLMWNMQNIFIGTARNWSKTALLWNLALDENYGPQNNGCSNCRGVITINSATGAITRNEEYYSIAHFSKFVGPGAVRIATTIPQSLPNVMAVGFQNTNGSKVLVVANDNSGAKAFSVNQGSVNYSYTLPAKSVATFVW
ncbi:MAG: glucan endo-1,6-beta-glucosidase [Bacteroidales bacterium]|nr:glucan endo-1,6-beta-glucosidase [Bacteroidales bacterium]